MNLQIFAHLLGYEPHREATLSERFVWPAPPRPLDPIVSTELHSKGSEDAV